MFHKDKEINNMATPMTRINFFEKQVWGYARKIYSISYFPIRTTHGKFLETQRKKRKREPRMISIDLEKLLQYWQRTVNGYIENKQGMYEVVTSG